MKAVYALALLSLCLVVSLSNAKKRTDRPTPQRRHRSSPEETVSRRFETQRRRQRDRRSRRIRNRQLPSRTELRGSRQRRRRFQRNGKTLVTRLAAHVQRIMLSINCRRSRRFLTSTSRCLTIQTTPFEQMRFFIAPPRTNALYSAVIPDGNLKDSTSHHAVAVVDPFPHVGFGHLVLIFYVDLIPRSTCRAKMGLPIGPLLCLSVARKAKCRSHYRAQLGSEDIAKKCEVNFLPLVYDEIQSNDDHDRAQHLRCVNNVAGFGSCPKQLAVPPQESCDVIKNTRSCTPAPKKRKFYPASMPCQIFATCDHAVLIYGSWSNLTSHLAQDENIMMMYKMLTRNGFGRDNVQLFYGSDIPAPKNRLYQHGVPSSDKKSLRTYVAKLCQTQLCVDSLVVYLNGPTTSDGSILLQDLNQNGEIEDKEVYRVNEFLDDITNCVTNHVILLADQSYSGMLRKALRQRIETGRESSWSRVVLLTSGDEFDYSWNRGATEHWRRLSPSRAISWAFENIGSLHSTPTITSRHHAEDHTIYGAPVARAEEATAESWKDIKSRYMGCQNIPFNQLTMGFSGL